MENRSNDLLVGSFVLIFVIAALGFVAWLTGRDVGGEAQTYEIYLRRAVTGLQTGSPVRYLGVPVGTVTDIRIDPETMKFEGDVEATGDYEIAGGGMCCFKVEKGRKKASFKMRGKKAAKKRSVKKAKASPPPPPPPSRAAQFMNGLLSEQDAVEPRAEI